MTHNFTPFPALKTERLTLRELSLNDVKSIFRLRVNKEVNKFITRNIPKNLSETRAFIDDILNLVTNSEGIFWVIESKNSQQLIGTISLRNFEVGENYAEIGYELDPNYQQKGFMSEAFKEVLKFAFQEMSIITIEAFTHKNNIASITLLEKHDFIFQPKRRDKGFDDNRIFKLDKK